ncbi:tripartite tricarboxylate transporter TctB family protein [Tropicimonas sp. IMCC6043]|uniref:tripartite tricarboxylate transporter TctB family protein n=1 Tax=Tropicimonas sp. IMCC6043 TaxID=2510645 RepID=UPI00101DB997|nr:tripartite tricarboxylate transporter TctB family protein [Tropicimonas sp. IMCC6043]RYH12249.1 tripartite tricarboxylate transporter TctB family protein [Tropicimonas sp. IMCC6043]
MRYKITELVVGTLLLLATLFAWQNLSGLPEDAKLFPEMVLTVMAVATVIMMIRSLTGASQRAQGAEIETWHFSINPKRMVGGLALFAGYLLIVETLGYYTASALFIIVAAAFAEYRSWRALLAATLAFCIFVYAVFGLLFNRPLPEEFFQSATVMSVPAGDVIHA